MVGSIVSVLTALATTHRLRIDWEVQRLSCRCGQWAEDEDINDRAMDQYIAHIEAVTRG